ncbi:hypothetical protein pb186bvf_018619 [Paramecium bursaria]
MSQKIHSLDTLRTRSLLPQEYNQSQDEPQMVEFTVKCVRDRTLKSAMKLKPSKKSKQFRFRTPITEVYIVENWKRHNQNIDEESDCCCKLF